MRGGYQSLRNRLLLKIKDLKGIDAFTKFGSTLREPLLFIVTNYNDFFTGVFHSTLDTYDKERMYRELIKVIPSIHKLGIKRNILLLEVEDEENIYVFKVNRNKIEKILFLINNSEFNKRKIIETASQLKVFDNVGIYSKEEIEELLFSIFVS